MYGIGEKSVNEEEKSEILFNWDSTLNRFQSDRPFQMALIVTYFFFIVY